MQRAIDLSQEHMRSGEGGPFGAVVVKDGVVVGEGWNRVTSAMDPTAHAEVNAIRQACARLQSFSLRGSELFTSCEPCPMCLAATYWARIDRIYYANSRADAAAIAFDDAWLYDEVSRSPGERALPMISLMRDDAVLVFREWQAKADKVVY